MQSSPGSRIALAVASAAVAVWALAAGLLVRHFGAGLGAVPAVLLWSGGLAAALGLLCSLVLAWRALAGRVGCGGGEVVGALLVVVVAGLCANALWLQPFHALKSAMCVAWMAGALGTWLALRPVLAGVCARKPARVLGFVLVQACVLVILLELGLRGIAVARPSQVFALPDRGAESFLRENRQPPGQMMWDLRSNSLGHFDEEFEPRGATPLVAAVGDSFSFGTVPHRYHFTTVCEGLLAPLKVANIGVPAIGPPEYALLIEREALPLRPDLIVVNLFLGNDIVFMGFDRPASASWWRRVFDRDQYLLAHVPKRALRLRREAQRLRREGGTGDVVPAFESRMSVEQLLERTPWLADPLLETPGMSEEAFVRLEHARAAAICGPDQGPYESFFRALESLRRAAGDVPLVFLLIPDEFQVEDLLWTRICELEKSLVLDRDLPQRRIREWCEQRGILYEDLLPRLRALPTFEDGRRHAYRLRDTHFNVLGNRVAGEGLGELVTRALRTL